MLHDITSLFFPPGCYFLYSTQSIAFIWKVLFCFFVSATSLCRSRLHDVKQCSISSLGYFYSHASWAGNTIEDEQLITVREMHCSTQYQNTIQNHITAFKKLQIHFINGGTERDHIQNLRIWGLCKHTDVRELWGEVKQQSQEKKYTWGISCSSLCV